MTVNPGPQSNPPPATAPDPGAAEAPVELRRIRSFVVRGGRMTVAQERAWQTLWPRYGRELDANTIDLDLWFGRHARRVVEIGFGNGESLLALAAMHPDQDFLGIEVHRPGVGHLLLQCEELGLTNVRVLCHDAMECLGSASARVPFDEVLLYFPGPVAQEASSQAPHRAARVRRRSQRACSSRAACCGSPRTGTVRGTHARRARGERRISSTLHRTAHHGRRDPSRDRRRGSSGAVSASVTRYGTWPIDGADAREHASRR